MSNRRGASQHCEIAANLTTDAPGTAFLLDSDEPGAPAHHLQTVQAHGGNRIILVPQPSIADPNDPLRWSKTKKWLVFLNGLANAFMGSVTGPIIAAGMIPLADKFRVPLSKLSYASGATLICQGFGNIFWMSVYPMLGHPSYRLLTYAQAAGCQVWATTGIHALQPLDGHCMRMAWPRVQCLLYSFCYRPGFPWSF